MTVTVELRRRYPSDELADRIARALAADRPAFLGTSTEGPELRFTVRAPSAESARATLEDLLACVQVAERTLGVPAVPERVGPTER